jgi:hypothetical protein
MPPPLSLRLGKATAESPSLPADLRTTARGWLRSMLMCLAMRSSVAERKAKPSAPALHDQEVDVSLGRRYRAISDHRLFEEILCSAPLSRTTTGINDSGFSVYEVSGQRGPVPLSPKEPAQGARLRSRPPGRGGRDQQELPVGTRKSHLPPTSRWRSFRRSPAKLGVGIGYLPDAQETQPRQAHLGEAFFQNYEALAKTRPSLAP